MKKILLISVILLASCSLTYQDSSLTNSENTSESNSLSNESTPSSPMTNSSSASSESSSTKESSSSSSSSSKNSSSSSSTAPTITLKDFTLKDSEITLQIGKTYQISPTFIPENATDKKLVYSVTNSNIATVSTTGLVTAKAYGNVTITITSTNNIKKTLKVNIPNPTPKTLPGLLAYTFNPTTAPGYGGEYFYASNLNPQVTNLANGVIYTQYNYASVSGAAGFKVCSLIVDFNYATIEAGTPNNSYYPYSVSVQLVKNQINAYQNATTRKVYAGVNGDFFGFIGSGNPNGALIKDGVVVSAKSASYENLVNGMWGFGVTYNNVPRTLLVAPNANTFYRFDNYIELYDDDAKMLDKYVIDYINDQYLQDHYTGAARARNYELVTKTGQSVSNKNVVYLEKIATYDNAVGEIKIPFDAKITSIATNFTGTISLNANQAALIVSSPFISKAKTNMRVRVGTTYSDNNDLSGLKTYIGGRHLLLQNYQMAPNLNKETTNEGTGNRQRTSIGITGDGKAIIVTCGSNNFTLTEMADFLRYLGCKDAINFDGGGSTGMFTRNANGTFTLMSGLESRAVADTVLVVEK